MIFPRKDSDKDNMMRGHQCKIAELPQQLKEKEDKNPHKKSDKSFIDKLTFAEVLGKLPKETADKTMSYVISVTRTTMIPSLNQGS